MANAKSESNDQRTEWQLHLEKKLAAIFQIDPRWLEPVTRMTVKAQDAAFVYHDGGRAAAGYRGDAGDCVVRAIAIATGLPYRELYDKLTARLNEYANTRRTLNARMRAMRNLSPRNGVVKPVYQPLLRELGWVWTPTMRIGQGCKVHLRADELPKGILIVEVSKHITCVRDGVIYDTYDPSRDGTRCVYGYWRRGVM